MKSNLLNNTVFLTFLFFFLMPILVEAITFGNPLKEVAFENIINSIINFIFWVAMAIAPIAIIVAAFYFFDLRR